MPITILALRSQALPPSIAGFFFESHWIWWLALAAVALAAILGGRARANQRLMRGGQVALALTLLWALAAAVVQTPAERLRGVHEALAQAAQKHDVDLIFSYFGPRSSLNFGSIAGDLGVSQISTADLGRDLPSVKTQIKAQLDQINIRETTFTRYETTFAGDGTAISRFVAITLTDGGALQTTWELQWDDVPGQDWRIRNATLLKLGP